MNKLQEKQPYPLFLYRREMHAYTYMMAKVAKLEKKFEFFLANMENRIREKLT